MGATQGWSNKAADHLPEPPQHLYGEGDMKTYAWAVHVIDKFKHTKVLVLSTDLDNVSLFKSTCDILRPLFNLVL